MMLSLLDQYREDFGPATAEELIDAAKRVAADLQLPAALAEVNERLLRHYVTEGVVSRPERAGREVRYGARHLLELLVTRMWVTQGYPLAGARPFTVEQSKDALVEQLKNCSHSNHPATAATLVSMFRASSLEHPGKLREARRMYTAASSVPDRKSLPKYDTSLGMVDVLQEMRTIEDRMQQHLEEMREQLKQMVGKSAAATEQLIREPLQMVGRQLHQQQVLLETAERQKHFVEEMFQELFERQRHELQSLFDKQSALLMAELRRQQAVINERATKLETADRRGETPPSAT